MGNVLRHEMLLGEPLGRTIGENQKQEQRPERLRLSCQHMPDSERGDDHRKDACQRWHDPGKVMMERAAHRPESAGIRFTSKRADPFALARTRIPREVARTASTSPVAIRASSRAV